MMAVSGEKNTNDKIIALVITHDFPYYLKVAARVHQFMLIVHVSRKSAALLCVKRSLAIGKDNIPNQLAGILELISLCYKLGINRILVRNYYSSEMHRTSQDQVYNDVMSCVVTMYQRIKFTRREVNYFI